MGHDAPLGLRNYIDLLKNARLGHAAFTSVWVAVLSATIAVQLWNYWSGGEPNKAAAVGVLLVLAMTLVTITWQWLSARRPVMATT